MSIFKPVFIDLKWEEALNTGITLKALHTYYINILPETIPLIIIPGFMGTKLYTFDSEAHKNVTIWDPDQPKEMFKKYGENPFAYQERKNAFIGKSCFDKNHLFVENYDDPNNHYLHNSISSKFYGGIIKELSNQQNWSSDQKFCFELPVYSFPYNWTDDNANSAQGLAEYIEKIMKFYKSYGKRCERVILITHSMGGLVARYACKQFIESQVLGVIHVAQPVNGAASTFWRMKCGFERRGGNDLWDPIKSSLVADTLGANSEAVTAVLANMPSGLQTLPNCEYQDNQGDPVWFRFVNDDDQHFSDQPTCKAYKCIDLPQHGDPYEEIYKKFDKFYYLINPENLSPGDPESTSFLTAVYLDNLARAKYFHKIIKGYSHPLTFNIYGMGPKYKSVDKIHYKVIIREPSYYEKYTALKKEGKDEEARNYFIQNQHLMYQSLEKSWIGETLGQCGNFKKVFVESSNRVVEISLKPAEGQGDGTVSDDSGRALIGEGGNALSNTQHIYNLKHDAALSGDDIPSRECLKMVINNVKSILDQQIQKFKVAHHTCKPTQENPICIDRNKVNK